MFQIDRLEALKFEEAEQNYNEEKLKMIKNETQIDELKFESKYLRKNLLNLMKKRSMILHDVTVKAIEPNDRIFVLIDEQNEIVSDRLRLVRLPNDSDRFEISDNRRELRLINEQNTRISEPISFESLANRTIEFEFIDEDHRSIRLIDTKTHEVLVESLKLIVQSISMKQSLEK